MKKIYFCGHCHTYRHFPDDRLTYSRGYFTNVYSLPFCVAQLFAEPRFADQLVYGGPAGQERNHAASQKPAFLEGLELGPDVNA